MECPENEFVCTVEKENKSGYYRLHTIWKENSFTINITTRNASWRGEMTMENCKLMSKQFDIDLASYVNECKEALTRNGRKQGILYAIENGSFVWKKTIDEDAGIRVKMGSIGIEPSNYADTVENILNIALECNKKLQDQIDALQQESNKCSLSCCHLARKLREVSHLKDEMERDLYARFLLILNSKKKHIAELEHFSRNKSHSLQKSVKTRVVKNSQLRHDKMRKEKDAYEMDTENDTEEEEVAHHVKQPIEMGNQREIDSKSQDLCIKSTAIFETECSKSKKLKVEEHDSDSTISDENLSLLAASKINSTASSRTKTGLPSTKNDLLDYFYGDG